MRKKVGRTGKGKETRESEGGRERQSVCVVVKVLEKERVGLRIHHTSQAHIRLKFKDMDSAMGNEAWSLLASTLSNLPPHIYGSDFRICSPGGTLWALAVPLRVEESRHMAEGCHITRTWAWALLTSDGQDPGLW